MNQPSSLAAAMPFAGAVSDALARAGASAAASGAAAAAATPFMTHFRSRQEALVGPNLSLPPLVRALLERSVESFKPREPIAFDPKDALTHVAFVLDSSSSMNHGKGATVEGFNAQLQVVREGAKLAGKTTFTDVHFDSYVKVRGVTKELGEHTEGQLLELTDQTYLPCGSTALYDALGETIAQLLSTPAIEAPSTAVLVTLFTDGEENASRVYDAATLKALVERLEATQRWTFALVGPRQGVTGLADLLSVRRKNIAGFDVSSVADKRAAFGKAAGANAAYMSLRAMGQSASASLYDDSSLPDA